MIELEERERRLACHGTVSGLLVYCRGSTSLLPLLTAYKYCCSKVAYIATLFIRVTEEHHHRGREATPTSSAAK